MKVSFVLTFTACVLMLPGCKDDAQQATPTPDVSPIGRQSDVEARPYKVAISMGAPCHLCNDVSPNTRVVVELLHSSVSIEQAKRMAMGEMVLESFPGRARVKGGWDVRGNSSYHFVPSKSLAPGDYLVRFPNAGTDLVVSPMPYNFFRVGPGPVRLRLVELQADKSDPSGGLAKVLTILTPPGDATHSVELEKEENSTWKAIALSEGEKAGVSIKANASDTIPTDQRLRVTVRSDLLDGAYTGVAGSKKVQTVVFRPKDIPGDPHQVIYHVRPELGIDLKTGEPLSSK